MVHKRKIGEDRKRDKTYHRRPVERSDGKKYESIAEAARDNNCLSKQANGYWWKYI